MSKQKTKAGILIQNVLRVVEGKGYHSLIISIEDGKIKIRRFSPGKPLEDVATAEEHQAVVINTTHTGSLQSAQGFPDDRVKELIVDMTDTGEEAENED